MPNQLEELQLSVNLNDQATPGLQRIRQELMYLGVEMGKLDKLGQQTKNLSRNLKDFSIEADLAHKAINTLRGAVVGLTAGFTVSALRQWSDQIRQTANDMRQIGSTYESFRNISAQLREVGISGAQTQQIMSGLVSTIAQLNRPGSSIRQALMMQTDPQSMAGMETVINNLRRAKTEVEAINIIRASGEAIYRNELKRTGNEWMARDVQARYYQIMQVSQAMINANRKLTEGTKEQQEFYKRLGENTKAFSGSMDHLSESMTTIADIFKSELLDPKGPLVTTIDLAAKGADWMAKSFLKIDNIVKAWSPGGGKLAYRGPTLFKEEGPNARPSVFQAPAHLQYGQKPFQHGGIVTGPTNALIGEAGPEAVIPLTGAGAARGKGSEKLDENTEELKKLNDNLMRLLGEGGGVGGQGVLGSITGGGVLPGPSTSSSSSNYSSPGSSSPEASAAPGTPGGPPIDMSSARMGMNPMWDNPNIPSPATRGFASFAQAAEGHPGAPPMQWPSQTTGTGVRDENGKEVDSQTLAGAMAIAKTGDSAAMKRYLAQNGFSLGDVACGAIASRFANLAGVKPPEGGAMASTWLTWGYGVGADAVNKAGAQLGTIKLVSTIHTYGTSSGPAGAPLVPGTTGGHVMTVVPGTAVIDPKTGEMTAVQVIDQYGVRTLTKGGQGIANLDHYHGVLRYAGDPKGTPQGPAAPGVYAGMGPYGPVPVSPPASATASGDEGDYGRIADAIGRAEGYGANPNNIPTSQNNPGDIKWGPFAKAHGATGPGRGNQAIFPDAKTGRAALIALLQTPAYKGKSIDEIGGHGSGWAEDPNWASNVAKYAGLPLNYVPGQTQPQEQQVAGPASTAIPTGKDQFSDPTLGPGMGPAARAAWEAKQAKKGGSDGGAKSTPAAKSDAATPKPSIFDTAPKQDLATTIKQINAGAAAAPAPAAKMAGGGIVLGSDNGAELDRYMGRDALARQIIGKLHVDVNAPAGTSVDVEGGGIFKAIQLNRQTQMRQARQGPLI